MTSFSVTRSLIIEAPPEQIHPHINDFHNWVPWSPWEELDHDLRRSYSGPESGAGAHYEWSGNRKAGQGSMEIVESTPERIEIALTFRKPFRSTSTVLFELTPVADGTEVSWTTRGRQGGLMGLVLKVVPMDRLLGGDMDKGLVKLEAVVENEGRS